MAGEIIEASGSMSPAFYLVLLAAIAIVALIIVLFIKLRYNFKQISKSIGISLLIAIGIEIIFLIGSFFVQQPVMRCKLGGYCPSNAELILNSSFYHVPAIFLIVLLIYLIAKAVRRK